jgi:hypothetical protein
MAWGDTQWGFIVREISTLGGFLAKENKGEEEPYHVTSVDLTVGFKRLMIHGNELFGYFIPLGASETEFLNWVLGEEQRYERQLVFEPDTKDPVCTISRKGLSWLLLVEWLPHFRERILLNKE